MMSRIHKHRRLLCCLLILLGFLLVVTAGIQAKEINSKNILEINVNEASSGAEFTLKNLETYEITVTIDFPLLENVASSTALPYTISLKGGETLKAFAINQVNRDQLWRYRFNYSWISGTTAAQHEDSYVYRLPYPSGYMFRVSQGYNNIFSHTGNSRYAVDWSMPEGTPICAARGGTVIGIKDTNTEHGTDESYKDLNNYVMIKHSDGTIGEYDHLRQYGVTVSLGQEVQPGDIIGYSGNTGFTSGPHLHFFVYKAQNGKTRQTFPTRFKTTAPEPEQLEEGKIYTAP